MVRCTELLILYHTVYVCISVFLIDLFPFFSFVRSSRRWILSLMVRESSSIKKVTLKTAMTSSCGCQTVSTDVLKWKGASPYSQEKWWSIVMTSYGLQPPTTLYVQTSAVKRLKYLIAINRIYVIVNSKLIAINRKFLSILNVPLFIYFFHHFIFILMPLSTWKSGLACFMQMFYFIENQHCQTGRYKIKL